MNGFITRLYFKVWCLPESRQRLLMFFFGLLVLQFGLLDLSQAEGASGEQVFKDAACTLLDSVIGKSFGAMLTVLAGAMAILASVMGSFKGAWVLLFVSVGCFIFPKLVLEFFPTLGCNNA